jgi:ABC-type multidrug transport system ATPase subunit
MEIRELECGEYILLNHNKVIARGTHKQCLKIYNEYVEIYEWANEISNNL